jgi:predicted AAA+ superfamily ATPase
MRSSESLAGRIAYLEMQPLHFMEIKHLNSFSYLWLNGGFPDVFKQEDASLRNELRMQFIQTYLERELPLLGLSASPVILRNLIRMIAWNNGQILNYSDFARSLGIEVNTVKRYMEFFEHSFLIRRLQPWFSNAGKRLIKSPRMYIRDNGILHALNGVKSYDHLDAFPQKGNSWESFVIQQIAACLKSDVNMHYYRTQDGTELDLILSRGMAPTVGFEIKLSNAPKLSKGTTIASQDLGNIPVWIITHSVLEDYSLSDHISVTSFERVFIQLDKLNLIRNNTIPPFPAFTQPER